MFFVSLLENFIQINYLVKDVIIVEMRTVVVGLQLFSSLKLLFGFKILFILWDVFVATSDESFVFLFVNTLVKLLLTDGRDTLIKLARAGNFSMAFIFTSNDGLC